MVPSTKLIKDITESYKDDVLALYASTDLANKKLKWKAEKNLNDRIRTAWNGNKIIEIVLFRI